MHFKYWTDQGGPFWKPYYWIWRNIWQPNKIHWNLLAYRCEWHSLYFNRQFPPGANGLPTG